MQGTLGAFLASTLVLLANCAFVSAEDPPVSRSVPGSEEASQPNLDTPTLGGKQFWTDELVHGAWRIQRNVLTGHFRLLDEKNMRRGWGSYDQCLEEFRSSRETGEITPLNPKVVIVLHGLIRSRESMKAITRYLQEQSDYSVLNVSYASARGTLADHAAALGRVIQRLEGVEEINFVGHSLGNLVVRHYLADHTDEAQNLRPDPRIRRIVMIAPPNNGTEMASRFRNNPVFQAVWGESGQELGEGWEELKKHLAVPQCEFGILAGGRGDAHGLNPLVSGDDDFVVAVEETRLIGAADFALVKAPHGTIMDNPAVQAMTLRFLKHGYFTTAENRQPILPTHATP